MYSAFSCTLHPHRAVGVAAEAVGAVPTRARLLRGLQARWASPKDANGLKLGLAQRPTPAHDLRPNASMKHSTPYGRVHGHLPRAGCTAHRQARLVAAQLGDALGEAAGAPTAGAAVRATPRAPAAAAQRRAAGLPTAVPAVAAVAAGGRRRARVGGPRWRPATRRAAKAVASADTSLSWTCGSRLAGLLADAAAGRARGGGAVDVVQQLAEAGREDLRAGGGRGLIEGEETVSRERLNMKKTKPDRVTRPPRCAQARQRDGGQLAPRATTGLVCRSHVRAQAQVPATRPPSAPTRQAARRWPWALPPRWQAAAAAGRRGRWARRAAGQRAGRRGRRRGLPRSAAREGPGRRRARGQAVEGEGRGSGLKRLLCIKH
jgi:hypothetical protein